MRGNRVRPRLRTFVGFSSASLHPDTRPFPQTHTPSDFAERCMCGHPYQSHAPSAEELREADRLGQPRKGGCRDRHCAHFLSVRPASSLTLLLTLSSLQRQPAWTYSTACICGGLWGAHENYAAPSRPTNAPSTSLGSTTPLTPTAVYPRSQQEAATRANPISLFQSPQPDPRAPSHRRASSIVTNLRPQTTHAGTDNYPKGSKAKAKPAPKKRQPAASQTGFGPSPSDVQSSPEAPAPMETEVRICVLPFAQKVWPPHVLSPRTATHIFQGEANEYKYTASFDDLVAIVAKCAAASLTFLTTLAVGNHAQWKTLDQKIRQHLANHLIGLTKKAPTDFNDLSWSILAPAKKFKAMQRVAFVCQSLRQYDFIHSKLVEIGYSGANPMEASPILYIGEFSCTISAFQLLPPLPQSPKGKTSLALCSSRARGRC
jgi:hypothetical protein